MGNNPSTVTRKSIAPETYRKSNAQNDQHNLDEEFSDLILRKVKGDNANEITNYTYQQRTDIDPSIQQEHQEQQSKEGQSHNILHPISHDDYPISYNQFSNDLIEDEFNELNDGLLDTDVQEVARNILLNEEENAKDIPDSHTAMEIDETFDSNNSTIIQQQSQQQQIPIDRHHTPTPDLTKVDFTKITNNHNANPQIEVKVDDTYVHPQINHSHTSSSTLLIPVEIKWVNTNKEPINKISIIGSFSNWRDVIKLSSSYQHPNEYITTINLPLGVHKLLYIINNEYRVSDQLPTATDQEGIFFNWFEVIDESHLFNHSINQPNHIGASTDYDANIISPVSHSVTPSNVPSNANFNRSFNSSTSVVAGRNEVERINRKSNSFLAKISKESSNFEHVEYVEGNNNIIEDDEDMKDVKLHEELQKQSENYPYGNHQSHHPSNTSSSMIPPGGHHDSSKYLPLTNSISSLKINIKPPKLEYSNEIPEMFVNYEFFKHKSANYELPEPPQLPAHLNNVLLNKISNSSSSQSNSQLSSSNIAQSIPNQSPTNIGQSSSLNSIHHHKRPPLRRADSSYYASNQESFHLSIPNHVILNHLMTTSIRNDVLTVACITRYSGKFVTQIMHSPADK
ncbi:Sip1p-Gal83p family protein [Scheffersomyces coipomensis]|uniref:Sip1p-Gal83p family protein n=1 Tax=Scheffersomyces coipomensis TaxID=1788519 RepID=UPI00315DA579